MRRIRRLSLLILVLGIGLVTVCPVHAEGLPEWLFPSSGHDSDYSSAHYWAPALSKAHDDHHGPRLDVYAPDRHPEIPETYIILEYCQPAVPAAATLIQVPSAPVTSRFKY